MSYLLQEEDELSKRGVIGTILFHLFLLLCFWFLFIQAVPPKSKGLIVNFGTVETGKGEETPQSEKAAEAPTPPEPVKEVKEAEAPSEPAKATPEPVIEQEVKKTNDVNAPALPTKKLDKKKEKKKEEKEKEKEKKKEEQPKKVEKKEEKKPEVDERALFKKRDNKNTNNSSQGNNSPDADMGDDTNEQNKNQNSDIYTPSRDIGMSDTGNFNVDLAGRILVKKPPVDTNFQNEGKVAVKIKVDEKGNVLEAEYTSKGSVGANANLKRIAIKAAKEAKFNFDPNAPAVQTGKITFTFKIR